MTQCRLARSSISSNEMTSLYPVSVKAEQNGLMQVHRKNELVSDRRFGIQKPFYFFYIFAVNVMERKCFLTEQVEDPGSSANDHDSRRRPIRELQAQSWKEIP